MRRNVTITYNYSIPGKELQSQKNLATFHAPDIRTNSLYLAELHDISDQLANIHNTKFTVFAYSFVNGMLQELFNIIWDLIFPVLKVRGII